MSDVRRIYVEKKKPYDVAAQTLFKEIRDFLQIKSVTDVRILIRYDVENVPEDVFRKAISGVFAEPPLDTVYHDTEEITTGKGVHTFCVQALPGQYDQRADSCAQALSLIGEDVSARVAVATYYMICGDIGRKEAELIRTYVCNPVDSHIVDDTIPETLQMTFERPADVPLIDGFLQMDLCALEALHDTLGLAMSLDDLQWIQSYFVREEMRDPTMTEIRVLDTYWSDHCRHTTFATKINEITIDDGAFAAPIRSSLESYLAARNEIYPDADKRSEKYICLMDIATAGMKLLKQRGVLRDMEESEENNACTVIVPVEINDENDIRTEEWLVFFKNETHNHPTEIEPFGGAATCLGGAIRDPLSGRGYVYQAMRITGAADPTVSVHDTMEGKLPQKKIVRDAAHGYSSYGNQIGLATGYVKELYHPGYVAKRMEIGAVMGAAPRKSVQRLTPAPGDKVILVGGRTGRDGIGGATGSSKAHTEESLTSCGAEVQKGNAPTERKIQRLFRREEVSRLIKKCNDFGAGGVCVAIGELADALEIDLDLVPKKYEGLDGTEIAISESQERMAVVVDAKDESRLIAYAAEENLEAVTVASVTDDKRLKMRWRGQTIVDLSRAFLDTNGKAQETDVRITMPAPKDNPLHQVANDAVRGALDNGDLRNACLSALMDLNVCSQKGLVEMFDASIGAASVLMPFGGRTQLSPVQTMAAKLPVLQGKSDACTLMSYGFDPYLSSWSPYHGAHYAVLHSVAKIVASGGDPNALHFTFQEYFGRMTEDPARWGMPLSALLGAFSAQTAFETAAIGGKDSMSGSFRDIDVPPTLVSFAVAAALARHVISPELKRAGNFLVLYDFEKDAYDLPLYPQVRALYDKVHDLIRQGAIVSCYAPDAYGLFPALAQMCFGNETGVILDETLKPEELFTNSTGYLIAEVDEQALVSALIPNHARKIGVVTSDKQIVSGETVVLLPEALHCWMSPLDKVFPVSVSDDRSKIDTPAPIRKEVHVCSMRTAKPRVFLPVMPGTNCEYDLTKAFTLAGADVKTVVFRNRDAADIRESIALYEKEIDAAQIIMFPGGFSAGDEPDGSAKFFATAFRNEKIAAATQRLLDTRDGLILGICNGFQTMIKLGLVPAGRITGQDETSPTLTYNTIGRHISRMAYLKIASQNSPWLMLCDPDTVYVSPVSHGEGRFVGDKEELMRLYAAGQVATQYADDKGIVTMDDTCNINGSYLAIEGITSPDGRCFGKMAHAERIGSNVHINIPGEQDMRLFEAGVRYFTT